MPKLKCWISENYPYLILVIGGILLTRLMFLDYSTDIIVIIGFIMGMSLFVAVFESVSRR